MAGDIPPYPRPTPFVPSAIVGDPAVFNGGGVISRCKTNTIPSASSLFTTPLALKRASKFISNELTSVVGVLRQSEPYELAKAGVIVKQCVESSVVFPTML